MGLSDWVVATKRPNYRLQIALLRQAFDHCIELFDTTPEEHLYVCYELIRNVYVKEIIPPKV
jgi:hypothetical protein